ncbi:C3 and PZP-like alpha-2-macroglobulin domain-containing protein 8 [Pecten maximus]|uniref:C3 and PZP-like alpha-2-macroglobulin domain-containing protein 8 n=1 Tax=Pecten maximus TaxID=6579 RepID=UPI001458C289|nr:C3 and PZP-like alpha-2-macroglobulin domain-containing protein 8 [Pecten maximus]
MTEDGRRAITLVDYFRISTTDVYGLINLTKYGYVYQPVPDCLAQFTFQVKACHNVHVGLFRPGEQSYTYKVVLGSFLNTKSKLRIRKSYHEIVHEENNTVDCNVYKKFWISWRNNVISAGHGNSSNNAMLFSSTDEQPNQIRYVGISTGYGASGQWKIPNERPPLQCYQHVQWSVSPGHQNTNMTSNITWSVTTDNLGQCAVACKRSDSCVSFVYNNEKNVCQGHGLKYHNITEGQGHTERGSHYFTKP